MPTCGMGIEEDFNLIRVAMLYSSHRVGPTAVLEHLLNEVLGPPICTRAVASRLLLSDRQLFTQHWSIHCANVQV